jgi:hypothetical protein
VQKVSAVLMRQETKKRGIRQSRSENVRVLASPHLSKRLLCPRPLIPFRQQPQRTEDRGQTEAAAAAGKKSLSHFAQIRQRRLSTREREREDEDECVKASFSQTVHPDNTRTF